MANPAVGIPCAHPCIAQEHEFEEVRRLSAELLGRCAGAWLVPLACNALDATVHLLDGGDGDAGLFAGIDMPGVSPAGPPCDVVFNGDLAIAKVCSCHGQPHSARHMCAFGAWCLNQVFVFAICHAAAMRGAEVLQFCSALAPRLLSLLLIPVVGEGPPTPGSGMDLLYKLQRGCIDCCAALLAAAADTGDCADGPSGTELVVEVANEPSAACWVPWRQLLGSFMRLFGGPAVPMPSSMSAWVGRYFSESAALPLAFRVCMANVLVRLCSMLQAKPRGSALLRSMAAFVGERCCRLTATYRGQPTLRGAAAQVLPLRNGVWYMMVDIPSSHCAGCIYDAAVRKRPAGHVSRRFAFRGVGLPWR